MKRKKYLILVFVLILICTGCAANDKKSPILSISTYGSGAVTNFSEKPMFLLNGMLYTFDENRSELELFCDIENCSHQFSDVLTEPSGCPAALGTGYIIGSFDNELYAAVNDTGWKLYKYSNAEKRFESLNHILEITDFYGAFHKNYFYYFSSGSLKRVKLTEDAESELLIEHMAGDEYYSLSSMTVFDELLLMTGGLTSIDSWIYNIETGELTKADIEPTAPAYYNGKLYYISGNSNTYTLYSYTLDSAEKNAILEFTTESMNIRIFADEDYIYITTLEDIQEDGNSRSSSLSVYTHNGQFVKEIPLNPIENDAMKTVMCSTSDYIFLGSSNAVHDQSLYMIEKASLTNDMPAELTPLLSSELSFTSAGA